MRNSRRTPSRLLGALLVLIVSATTAQAADELKIDFERYTLDNGVEVILHQDNSVPLVAVSVWYHVGSGDEVPGKSGFAHLFEHMMFQGSTNTGEDAHFEILRRAGASNVNGTTNSDRTNYFEEVPSHHLETALWLESDRMGYMLPLLTDKSLSNQRDVVRNERRFRYDNVAYGATRFVLAAALYPEGHPYRYMTIGRHEDIEGASLEDVIGFFKTWYVPANATLAISGDIDVARTKELVQKWFGNFPKSQRPVRRGIAAPRIKDQRIEVKDTFAKLRRVQVAWHSPAMFTAGDADFDVLADALGRQGTGRLYKVLVHEKQLAQAVAVYQASAEYSSTFNVIVDLKPEADLSEVESIIAKEIEAVVSAPVGVDEINRAVVNIQGNYIWGLESILGRGEQLQAYNHYRGDPGYMSQDLARYKAVTPSSMQKFALQYLRQGGRVVVVTMPAEGGK